VQIRKVVPDEAGPLAALWLRSRAASVPAIPPTVHTDEEVHRWFEEIVLPRREVWVVDRGGELVALMVLDRNWIDQLYVEPSMWGMGMGGALVEYAMGLRPAGLKLWTFQSNLGARRFYEARGFFVTAMTAGDNEERAPDVCYEWSSSRSRPAGRGTAGSRVSGASNGQHRS